MVAFSSLQLVNGTESMRITITNVTVTPMLTILSSS